MKTRLLKKLRRKYYKRYKVLHPSPNEYRLYRWNDLWKEWEYDCVTVSSEALIMRIYRQRIDQNVIEEVWEMKRKRNLKNSYPF